MKLSALGLALCLTSVTASSPPPRLRGSAGPIVMRVPAVRFDDAMPFMSAVPLRMTSLGPEPPLIVRVRRSSAPGDDDGAARMIASALPELLGGGSPMFGGSPLMGPLTMMGAGSPFGALGALGGLFGPAMDDYTDDDDDAMAMPCGHGALGGMDDEVYGRIYDDDDKSGGSLLDDVGLNGLFGALLGGSGGGPFGGGSGKSLSMSGGGGVPTSGTFSISSEGDDVLPMMLSLATAARPEADPLHGPVVARSTTRSTYSRESDGRAVVRTMTAMHHADGHVAESIDDEVPARLRGTLANAPVADAAPIVVAAPVDTPKEDSVDQIHQMPERAAATRASAVERIAATPPSAPAAPEGESGTRGVDRNMLTLAAAAAALAGVALLANVVLAARRAGAARRAARAAQCVELPPSPILS